jgi:hypothetical protein
MDRTSSDILLSTRVAKKQNKDPRADGLEEIVKRDGELSTSLFYVTGVVPPDGSTKQFGQ